MSTELNGPGPIAGDYMGGSGDNLNESPDSSTPGGGSNVPGVMMVAIHQQVTQQHAVRLMRWLMTQQ